MGEGGFQQSCSSQNHRIIQAGRILRRSLVQPPAQSKVNSRVWSGCSETYPTSKDVDSTASISAPWVLPSHHVSLIRAKPHLFLVSSLEAAVSTLGGDSSRTDQPILFRPSPSKQKSVLKRRIFPCLKQCYSERRWGQERGANLKQVVCLGITGACQPTPLPKQKAANLLLHPNKEGAGSLPWSQNLNSPHILKWKMIIDDWQIWGTALKNLQVCGSGCKYRSNQSFSSYSLTRAYTH